MVGNLKLLFYNLHIKMMSDMTRNMSFLCFLVISLFLSNLSKNSTDSFFFLIYFWLCWIFMAVLGLSLVMEIGAAL